MPSLLTSSYRSRDEPFAAVGSDVLSDGPRGADDQGQEFDDPGPDWNRPRLAPKKRIGERDRPGEPDPRRGRPDGQERDEREHVPGKDIRARHDDAPDEDDHAIDDRQSTREQRPEQDPRAERQHRDSWGVEQGAHEPRIEELRRDVLRKGAERAGPEVGEGSVSGDDDERERRQRREP